jgi:hypothetical protein
LKRDILIIDTDSDFISELHNSLESKVNLISAQSIEEAFAFCNANKNKNSSQSNINPSVIVVGNGCKISKELKDKLKEDYPEFYDEEALQTFEPIFYCNLFRNAFQTSLPQKPKACICANLEQYPFKGRDQDITKKLGYCMQHNIALMNRMEKNKKLILNVLKNYIFQSCNIKESDFNR